jgi:hypothetical protein
VNLLLQSEISHCLPHSKTKTTAQPNGPETDNPVKSISEDSDKTAAPNAADKRPQPRARRSDRSAKNAKWVESLRSSDVNRLWTELHRIVSHHPLVRASRSAGLLVEEGYGAAYTDLTQELFVQLLSKNRFEHYLETSMSDYEIECEISQIENVTRKAIVSPAVFPLSSSRAPTFVALTPAALTTNHIAVSPIAFMD